MKTFWIISIGFLLLLKFTNTISNDLSLDSTQFDENESCNSILGTASDCSGEASSSKILAACKRIEKEISTDSKVFYAPDRKYFDGISHFSINTIELAACSVEPSTTADVAMIMKIIRQTRIPFAIKSGGHSFNPKFSSTTGVHIAMRCFRKVTFHANNQTVDVGSGATWDEVYEALEPYNVSVIGGQTVGVGVGGFLLGGGYGWKSNQYGLGSDNVFEYELVSPNGTIVYVNHKSYPDISFGLKGGFNNFGIVTNFNMRALPQTNVYGGFLLYGPPHYDDILIAVANFHNTNTDPKAHIDAGFIGMVGMASFYVAVFYDSPTAPEQLFKEFLNIDHIGKLDTYAYLPFIRLRDMSAAANMRGQIHSISIKNLTSGLLQKIKEQFIYYSSMLHPMACRFINFAVEPYLPGCFENSQDRAYPHTSTGTVLLPIRIEFGWQLPLHDDLFINAMKSTADIFLKAAIDDGQDIDGEKQILYPNSALENTPLSKMYGDNVARLKTIRQAWDPENVMYLTGSFKF